MIKHTISHLGPAVSAERMVKDYVNNLYQPAAVSGRAARADDFTVARELASWTGKVRGAWSGVAVDQVDTLDISDNPQIGDRIRVRAIVTLDGLDTVDVSVQVVHGRALDSDELRETSILELAPVAAVGDPAGSQHEFAGDLEIDRSGSFGYTVRVLPKNGALASQSELGLITNA
jgi:starch phosphorylase